MSPDTTPAATWLTNVGLYVLRGVCTGQLQSAPSGSTASADNYSGMFFFPPPLNSSFNLLAVDHVSYAFGHEVMPPSAIKYVMGM